MKRLSENGPTTMPKKVGRSYPFSQDSRIAFPTRIENYHFLVSVVCRVIEKDEAWMDRFKI
jgi:hypothetical protein